MATKNWTAEETNLLRKNCRTHSVPELAEMTGRSKQAILCKLSNLGLKIGRYKKWTREDAEYLKQNYALKTDAELAAELNCSERLLKEYAGTLGFNRKEIKELRRQHQEAKEAAAKFERPRAEYSNRDLTGLVDYYSNPHVNKYAQ